MEARVWEFVGTWRKPYRASSSIDLKPTEIEVLCFVGPFPSARD